MAELNESQEDRQDKIANLCKSKITVSSKYAEDPSKTPGQISEELYGSHLLTSNVKPRPDSHEPHSPDGLAWARSCGNFGKTNPSDLFLHAFHDLLQCQDHDPLANCVSPPLCGSTGFLPMTIIAPLNDQLRHMSNLLVRAKKEVLLATNFWKFSGASTFVNDALIELSRRAGERGQRVVVRLMYDRGAIKQVWMLKSALITRTSS